MTVGRNDYCPCGSGLKYKKCCLNKETVSASSLTIKQRNIVLINEIYDIFGFTKGKKWDDLKKEISGDQIQALYKLVAKLWRPATNLQKLLPKSDNKLRALFVGHYRPENILQNIIRYSLYTDEILVILPLVNPNCIARDYNPIEYPDKFKIDTLKNLAFILELVPWIDSGIVNMIPNPGDFDYDLRMETWKLAKKRVGKIGIKKKDYEEYKPYAYDDFKRDFYRLPKEALSYKLKEMDSNLSDEKIKDVLEYIDKQKKQDFLYLDQPIQNGESQMNIFRTGVNLEMAMYIAQITGAYLYTDLSFRWKEILSASKKKLFGRELWSPLTKTFQNLDFKFLNKIDSNFACSLRKDGRLENFRLFLRKIWSQVDSKTEKKEINSLARDFSDELGYEFNKAESEWKDIDKSIVKWVTGSGGISTILTAGMNWTIPASGFCLSAVGKLLTARMDRNRFRNTIPMSVFIDLKKKK